MYDTGRPACTSDHMHATYMSHACMSFQLYPFQLGGGFSPSIMLHCYTSSSTHEIPEHSKYTHSILSDPSDPH